MKNIIVNIAKMAFWLALIPVFLKWFGPWGGLWFALTAFARNLLSTFMGAYRKGYHKATMDGAASEDARRAGLDEMRFIARTIFSFFLGPDPNDKRPRKKKKWYLPFIAYGCYCAPGYGSDGPTHIYEPIDLYDGVCECHDWAMESAKLLPVNSPEYVHAKNAGDWACMKGWMKSENSANGVFILGSEIGFGGRIIARTLMAL